MTPQRQAEELINRVNQDYGSETFVSFGYGYYDDMVKAVAELYRQLAAQDYTIMLGRKVVEERDNEIARILKANENCGLEIATLRSRLAVAEGMRNKAEWLFVHASWQGLCAECIKHEEPDERHGWDDAQWIAQAERKGVR
jgi:hypothetical protein